MKDKMISRILESDRGVSPVIGVILMVAITVILAAVIGAFVLGLGDDLGNSSGPSASLSLDEGTLSHNGGDTLTDAELRGAVSDTGNIPAEFAAGDSTDISGSLDGPGTVTVVVGDTVVASFDIDENSGGSGQQAANSISGTVTFSDGAGDINDVTFVIGTSEHTDVTTDEGGAYTLNNVPEGPYTVEASAAGYTSDSNDNVNAGDEGVDFTLTAS